MHLNPGGPNSACSVQLPARLSCFPSPFPNLSFFSLLSLSRWVLVGPDGFANGGAASLALNSAGTPFVAFYDETQSYKATVEAFSGGAWSAIGAAGFSAGAVAQGVSLAFNPTDDTPWVALKVGACPPRREERTGARRGRQRSHVAARKGA